MTIHCAVDTDPPRSLPIGPNATFTIVASRVIIRKPSEIAVSPSVGLRTTVERASDFIGKHSGSPVRLSPRAGWGIGQVGRSRQLGWRYVGGLPVALTATS